MDLGLKNKLCLVTGATGGLGRATADLLASEGARVWLTDVDESKVAELSGDPRFLGGSVADLTRQDEVDALAERLAEHGGADVVVHAAGVTGAKGHPLEMSDEDWREAWDIDFMSAVRVSRAFVPVMQRKGWGRAVFVTSENAVQPYADEAVYNTAKAALSSFARSLAHVAGPDGVLVNAVAPAFVKSPMTDQMMRSRAEKLGVSMDEAVDGFLAEERPNLVLRRRGRPEEVAAVIGLLCSEAASFTLGSAYRVDGGAVATVDG